MKVLYLLARVVFFYLLFWFLFRVVFLFLRLLWVGQRKARGANSSRYENNNPNRETSSANIVDADFEEIK